MAFLGREDIIGTDEILYQAAELDLPDTLGVGLEALHFLGGGVAAALRNWATGKADAVAIGTPVERSDSLSLTSGTNFLETATAEPMAGTYMAVARVTSSMAGNSARPLFLSTNADSTPLAGASLYPSTSTTLRALANYTASGTGTIGVKSAEIIMLNAGLANWNATMAEFDDTATTVRNLTTGQANSIASGGTRTPNVAKVRIGSGYNAQFTGGTCDLAFAAVWSRVITSAERATMYAWLKRAMATEGLTI